MKCFHFSMHTAAIFQEVRPSNIGDLQYPLRVCRVMRNSSVKPKFAPDSRLFLFQLSDSKLDLNRLRGQPNESPVV